LAPPDLDERGHVLDCHAEDFQRLLRSLRILFLVQPALDVVERVVDNALRDGLLAVEHDAVDELGELRVVETRVGAELVFARGDSACHGDNLPVLSGADRSPAIARITRGRRHENRGATSARGMTDFV